jgi:hypothetical protein
MKKLVILLAAATLISACSKKETKSSGHVDAPTPAPKTEKAPAKGPVKPPVKTGDATLNHTDLDTPPQTGTPSQQPPRQSQTPPQQRPPQQTPPQQRRSQVPPQNSQSSTLAYTTLIQDGLLETLKNRMGQEGVAQLSINKRFASRVENAKMLRNAFNGQVGVSIRVKEGSRTMTYSFGTTPSRDRMTNMYRVTTNLPNEGTGNLRAAFMCVDMSEKCSVAVVKLMHPAHAGAQGEKAMALILLRRQIADIAHTVRNKDSENKDLIRINEFFINSSTASGANEPNSMEDAYVESTEVAFGPSTVRTIILGRNDEILAHSAPLVKDDGSGINLRMRPLERATEDIDVAELSGRTTRMSSTIGFVELSHVDGNGNVMVYYKMAKQTKGLKDEFAITFTPHPVGLLPGDYIDLR